MLYAVIALFVVCVSYAPADAIKCYSCQYNSQLGSEANCMDTFKPDGGATTMTVMGTMPCEVCSKIKTKFSNYETIIRSCMSTAALVGKMECNSAKGAGAEIHTCFCDTPDCNKSVVHTASFIATLIVAFITLYAF